MVDSKPIVSKSAVLITGAGEGGIGGSLAQVFARKGYHVFATGRRLSTMDNLAKYDNIERLELDVTKMESIKAAYEVVKERTGGQLAFLVNNAGLGYCMPAIDIDLDDLRQIFEVNVFGVIAVTRIFAPLLITSSPPGRIVQIGSVSGTMPYTFSSGYNASKAALHSYSDTLRTELAPFGVKVITVVTGGVKTLLSRYPRQLPEGSAYESVTDDFQRRVTYSQLDDICIPSLTYAESVVAHVTKSNPSLYFHEGKYSWKIWAVNRFLPKLIWDYILPKRFGIPKLAYLWRKGAAMIYAEKQKLIFRN